MKSRLVQLVTITAVGLSLVPAPALAEPAASTSHLPLLWLVAIVVAGGSSWLLVRLMSRIAYQEAPAKKWGLLVLLFAILLVFVAPIIVALGSILITGRTM